MVTRRHLRLSISTDAYTISTFLAFISHFTPMLFGVCSLHYEALPWLVIGVGHKPMKIAKRLMIFRPPFGLNNEYEGNFTGVCLPVNGGSKGA